MKLAPESKLFLSIIAVTVAIVGIAAVALTKPAPVYTRYDLIPSDAHTLGSLSAPVYLVEFSDFECPACISAKPIVDDILKTYGGKLLYAYRYYPLAQHPFAQKAAQAAQAAGLQGKFWDMYALLFAQGETLSDATFSKLVTQLDLNPDKFSSDFMSESVKQRILKDVNDGNRFVVNATPTFFLNGKKLELSSYDQLKTAVDAAVKGLK